MPLGFFFFGKYFNDVPCNINEMFTSMSVVYV